MVDRTAVIDSGHIEQVGRTVEVFFYPKSKKFYHFIGALNILDYDYCRSFGKGVVAAACWGLATVIPDGGNRLKRIALVPKDIYISETKVPGLDVNPFSGVITCINSTDEVARANLEVGENDLTAEMPHHIFENMSLAVGKEVF